jgi:phosphopentomutase
VLSDPDTMLIALADHGGGGIVPDDHDGDHPLNLTIPLLIVGGRVPWCTLYGDVSILDVAPTIAWALGVDAPQGWPGRALCVIPDVADVQPEPGSMVTDRRVRRA